MVASFTSSIFTMSSKLVRSVLGRKILYATSVWGTIFDSRLAPISTATVPSGRFSTTLATANSSVGSRSQTYRVPEPSEKENWARLLRSSAAACDLDRTFVCKFIIAVTPLSMAEPRRTLFATRFSFAMALLVGGLLGLGAGEGGVSPLEDLAAAAMIARLLRCSSSQQVWWALCQVVALRHKTVTATLFILAQCFSEYISLCWRGEVEEMRPGWTIPRRGRLASHPKHAIMLIFRTQPHTRRPRSMSHEIVWLMQLTVLSRDRWWTAAVGQSPHRFSICCSSSRRLGSLWNRPRCTAHCVLDPGLLAPRMLMHMCLHQTYQWQAVSTVN